MVIARHTGLILSQLVLFVHRISDLVPLLPDKVFYGDHNTGSRHASEGDGVTQKVPRTVGRAVDLSGNTDFTKRACGELQTRGPGIAVLNSHSSGISHGLLHTDRS